MKIPFSCCLLTCFLSTPVFADEQVIIGADSTAEQYVPKSLSVDITTMGVGTSLIWDVHPLIHVMAGYTDGSSVYYDALQLNNTLYKKDQQSHRAWYANAVIQPWATQSNIWLKSMYITSGFAYINQKNDLISKNTGQALGQINYKDTFAPYIGLGLYTIWGIHWGSLVELGTYYMGEPSIYSDQFDQLQKSNLQSDHNNQWQPTAKFSLVYKF